MGEKKQIREKKKAMVKKKQRARKKLTQWLEEDNDLRKMKKKHRAEEKTKRQR